MAHRTQSDINATTLLDAQERLAKFELHEHTNAATDIQLTQSPSFADEASTSSASSTSANSAQDENIIQKIIEHRSSSNLDKSHVGSNGDTLSDFGSDNDEDAVWDQALDDTESVQEKSTGKEEQVDYLAMMENSESLANRGKVRWEEGWRKSQCMARVGNDPWEMGWKTVRPESPAKKKENARWEVEWNIAEELMVGEIMVNEMGWLDPDEEIYSWEHKTQ
ncbi:hypothetical protein HDU80_006461 [Chytriomyces hyalinus]|nr:hypothetical protein HDU80_006461 [Chytriomyces hyalinus]